MVCVCVCVSNFVWGGLRQLGLLWGKKEKERERERERAKDQWLADRHYMDVTSVLCAPTKQTGVAVIPQTCIWEVPNSNLIQVITYMTWFIFSVVYFRLSMQMSEYGPEIGVSNHELLNALDHHPHLIQHHITNKVETVSLSTDGPLLT
jgi:hypothetical protein